MSATGAEWGRPAGPSRWLALPAIGLIRAYQLVISPIMPNICRFHPSCSHYALEAYRRRGVWWGSCLTLSRLLRCNPFFRGGFDPVPPASPETAAAPPETAPESSPETAPE